jgi:small-conductance mechanosensitive channel
MQLDSVVFGNSFEEYLIAISIFAVVLAGIHIFKYYILSRLQKLAEKTKTTLDDSFVAFLSGINWPFYVIVSLYAAHFFIVVHSFLTHGIFYIMVLTVGYYTISGSFMLIDYIIKKKVDKKKQEADEQVALIRFLGTIIKGTVVILIIVLLLSNMGINVSSILAGIGIGGIAIAFALQNILSDLFSAVSIFFDKPFQRGDFIVIGSDLGVVKHIGLKSTRIETLQGQELVVSNNDITTTRVNNYKKMKKRRIVFSFGVEYGTVLQKLKKIPNIVKEIIEKTEYAEFDRAHFKEFGNFSLNFEVVFYVPISDYAIYMDTQQEINYKLVDAFKKEKIEFAFPTQTIYMKK